MALVKVGITKMKLTAGSKVSGYLLSHKAEEIVKDGEPDFTLCKVVLKVEKIGPTVIWLQGDYAHVLVDGLMTEISKVKTNVDGKEGTRTDVSQDDADKISV